MENITLVRGIGSREENRLCVMSLTALLAGEGHTDKPVCACPVLTAAAIRLNDTYWWSSDSERTEVLKHLAPILIGTRSTPDTERRRANYLGTMARTVFAASAIETAADKLSGTMHESILREHANVLRLETSGRRECLSARDASAAAANAAAASAANAAAAAAYADYADYAADYAAASADYAAAAAAYAASADYAENTLAMRTALLDAIVFLCDESNLDK